MTHHARIYLPARDRYGAETQAAPSEELLERYIAREFPGMDDIADKSIVYPVPGEVCLDKMERQAATSEEMVFRSLQGLNVPGLWCVFFHGRSYGGTSFRNERCGRLMLREHDFVAFVKHEGLLYLLLIEVKSTCDDPTTPFLASPKLSDSKMIKNNKRSAQHQLRDHLEILFHELRQQQVTSDEICPKKTCDSIQTYICWPFLSSTTADPQRQPMHRWKDDGKLHVFRDEFLNQEAFNRWFSTNALAAGTNTVPRVHWMALLNRFVLLSCGVFLDEMDEGLTALLTQEQLYILDQPPFGNGRPLIVHGAAGTGKTLLIIQKLKMLHRQGELHEAARALYICYWPGIRCDVTNKLKKLGIAEYVDTARFYIAMDGFLQGNDKRYRHIFMDESEAICLAFKERLIQNTFDKIHSIRDTSQPTMGCLWFMVDINQAAIFLPKHSPNLLKTPHIVLSKVIRSTKNIYQLFQRFYNDPFPSLSPVLKRSAYTRINHIGIGHEITGPPIYWAESRSGQTNLSVATKVVIDLCSSKGVRPNDICVLPFIITDEFLQNNVNKEIGKYFVENAFMPQAMCNVESFLINKQSNHFVIPWLLRAKGLEFQIVVLVIEDDDIDFNDAEDRRKLYIMSSRCTCLLAVVSSRRTKEAIDIDNTILDYPYTLRLPCTPC